jgi:aspartate ammonia-lyase
VLVFAVSLAGNSLWCQQTTQSSADPTRTEHDLLGEKQVPANAYYGIQTLRALENFQLSGVPINHYPGFVEAWAYVKLAAAQANYDAGTMKKERLDAIEKACNAVIAGKYHDQFQVDWYQGGAGTSTNMNANEVLANIGLELTGHKKGEYQFLEPHDDLNMSQSTNDSYPTAIKVALILRNDKLIEELQRLADSFRAKGNAYLRITKMGRTELQDAVPMTVGQEFYAFASSLQNEIQWLKDSEKPLYVENMGATAIGTGINVPKGYPEKFSEHLSKLLNKPIVAAPDMIAATWDQQGFVIYSSALKSLAIKLSKISSDLILLTSGPRAGLNEIDLPAIQPGSSIMPGKVNPVVPEVMNLVTFRVMGNDFVVTLAAHSGQLQLNAYEPVEGVAMMESQALLFNTSKLMRTKCVDGIVVDEKQLQHYMETTVGIVTALNPVLGYDKATELAQEAYSSGKGVLEIIREQHLLTEAQIKELLDPAKLTNLDPSKYTQK